MATCGDVRSFYCYVLYFLAEAGCTAPAPYFGRQRRSLDDLACDLPRVFAVNATPPSSAHRAPREFLKFPPVAAAGVRGPGDALIGLVDFRRGGRYSLHVMPGAKARSASLR